MFKNEIMQTINSLENEHKQLELQLKTATETELQEILEEMSRVNKALDILLRE